MPAPASGETAEGETGTLVGARLAGETALLLLFGDEVHLSQDGKTRAGDECGGLGGGQLEARDGDQG